MKILNLIFLLILISINYVETVASSDISEINKVVDNYCAAIHSQNKNDFKSIFSQTKKCSLVSVSKVFEGLNSMYADFVLGLQKLYARIDLIKDEDLQINFINDEFAIVIFKYHTECIMRESGELGGIKGVETQVMIKEDGNWKIVHIHYSKS